MFVNTDNRRHVLCESVVWLRLCLVCFGVVLVVCVSANVCDDDGMMGLLRTVSSWSVVYAGRTQPSILAHQIEHIMWPISTALTCELRVIPYALSVFEFAVSDH